MIADTLKKPLQDHREELEEINAKAREAHETKLGRIEAALATKRIETAIATGKDEKKVHGMGDLRGLDFARVARAHVAAAKESQSGRTVSPAQFAAQHWKEPEESPVMKALLLSDTEQAGALAAPGYSNEIIELLREVSVVSQMGPILADISMGSMTWPKHTGPSTAFYVGESQIILESGQTLGQFQLTGRKVAALVAISNDLLRNPSVSSDAWFRDEMVFTVNLRMDLAKIRGDGLENTPRGLRFNVLAENIQTQIGLTTPNLAAVVNTLSGLWLLLRDANVKFKSPGWLMAPRTEKAIRDSKNANGFFIWREEMTMRGTIDGIPFKSTTQIPDDLGTGGDSELYLVDFREMVDATEFGIQIDASQDAAYHDAGSTLVAAFPRDLTVLRVMAKHDFGAANAEAIALVPDIQWIQGSED